VVRIDRLESSLSVKPGQHATWLLDSGAEQDQTIEPL
jgi:hypothetical protein